MNQRRALSVATGVIFAVTVTGTAVATNFGGPRDSGKHCNSDPYISQCVGENVNHTIFIEASVDAELLEEIQWSIANYNSVSDINMFIVASTPSDVKVRAVDYGSAATWWASTACDTAGVSYGGSETPLPGNRWCKPQIFRYNLYWRASKYPSDNNERSITCHELGHTIGLRHATSSTGDPSWASSCMKDPAQTNITTTTHDRNHINARY